MILLHGDGEPRSIPVSCEQLRADLEAARRELAAWAGVKPTHVMMSAETFERIAFALYPHRVRRLRYSNRKGRSARRFFRALGIEV